MFENVISAIKDRNHDKWADQEAQRGAEVMMKIQKFEADVTLLAILMICVEAMGRDASQEVKDGYLLAFKAALDGDQDKAREICIEAKDKQQTDTIARKKGILKNV